MFGMSNDQLMSLLRQVLPALGGLAIGLGWLSPEKVASITAFVLQVAGPAMVIAGAVLAVIANTRKSIMASASKPVEPGAPAPQIILPVQEAVLAQSLPANVNTTADVKVVAK